MADPEFTDTARAALMWVLWHHQGGSSQTGQAVRFALGMGQFDRMTADQVAQAKAWAPGIPGLSRTDRAGVAPSDEWTNAVRVRDLPDNPAREGGEPVQDGEQR